VEQFHSTLLDGIATGGITKTSVCGSQKKAARRLLKKFKEVGESRDSIRIGIQRTGLRSGRK